MRVRAAGRARDAGMTLLEIMIVLAIIGALMGFLIGPKLLTLWEEARVRETRILINQYESAIIHWRLEHPEGDCPATLAELHAGSLANAPPTDAWGQPLVYRCPGRDGAPWDVLSTGRDRVAGTADDVRRTTAVAP